MNSFFFIFWLFFKVTLVSFGGIYSVWALAQKEIVVNKKIENISQEDFTKVISFSHLMPGPRAAGFSLLGYKMGGAAMMLAVFLGLIMPGFIIVNILSRFYHRLGRFKSAKGFYRGANIAIVAILLLFLWGMMKVGGYTPLFLLLTLIVFLLNYHWQLHPLILVISSAILGYFLL